MSYFVINSEIKAVQGMDELSIRKNLVLWEDKFQLIEYHDKKGSISERHNHLNEDMLCYLVSGKVKETVGNETKIVTGGDCWYVPAGVEHEAYTMEDSVIICIFNPPAKERM
jgi:quercetin dioxygenase-like cupin family protein